MLIHNAEVTGSLRINNVPFNSGSFSGSFQGDGSQLTGITGASTASYVEYSNVANKPALVSSSAQIVGYGIFATTGSNQFNGSQAITGSLTVTGQVVAQTLNVQQVTSSIVYSSGSNIFGNDLGNTQQFTGSVSVTGSMAVAGTVTMDNTEFFKLSVGTTAQRPSSPSTGMMRFNTDVNFLEFYNGSFWQSTAGVNSSFTSAVGGETTTISENGITYRVHFFTSVGTSTFQVVSGNNPIEYLVVGGGGGGAAGNDNGNGTGGGGAGGFLTGSITLNTNTYTVVVGGGGVGGTPSGTNDPQSFNMGASGQNSTFHNITATGGGRGGRAGVPGDPGGSGGGGGNGASGGTGIAGQGFAGGNGGNSEPPYRGGGGGGAASAGDLGTGGTGNGGAGKSSSISGTSLFYAGGGGGGAVVGNTGGTGGSSVGGNGSATANVAGGNGTANSGAGGGGGTWGGSFLAQSSAGGSGGSGIVIVRYRIF
jgi:hypothetical protein